MEIKNVRNISWSNPEHTTIDCEVDHVIYGWISFTASPNDVELHGREIYEVIVSGKYGVISEYEPPVYTTEQLSEQARLTRNNLLSQLDSIVSNPLRWASLSQQQRDEYADYRQTLLDVPQQSGFPTEINWPTLPE
jgi:hypothetical protein